MAEFTQIENLDELIKGTIDGKVIEQSAERLLPSGENFGSVIYKVDFKTKNGDLEETYHAVAKCTPPNKFTQKVFNTQITFKTEIGWYTSVIPTYKQFQREHGVKDVVNFFQTLYGARISLDPNSDVVDEHGVILTENLITLGYKNDDRHIGFDLKTSKSVLRDLAAFHAVPLALKQENNDLFEEKIAPFLPHFSDPDLGETDMLAGIKGALKEIPELEPYLDRVFECLDKNKSMHSGYDINEPWGSVCHNDFWTNNIMITEEENPRTIILDLQIPSYASLVGDVVFFVALSVSLDVIKEQMDELLQHYWDHFLRNLTELGANTKAFSYEGFLEELSAQAKRQLAHALFIGQFVFQEKGHKFFDSTDVNYSEANFIDDKVIFSRVHKDRYSWIITEFIKRNWI